MISHKKIYSILLGPPILVILILSGCFKSKKANCSIFNNKEKICAHHVLKENAKNVGNQSRNVNVNNY
jgi:hypothetical protein